MSKSRYLFIILNLFLSTTCYGFSIDKISDIGESNFFNVRYISINNNYNISIVIDRIDNYYSSIYDYTRCETIKCEENLLTEISLYYGSNLDNESIITLIDNIESIPIKNEDTIYGTFNLSKHSTYETSFIIDPEWYINSLGNKYFDIHIGQHSEVFRFYYNDTYINIEIYAENESSTLSYINVTDNVTGYYNFILLINETSSWIPILQDQIIDLSGTNDGTIENVTIEYNDNINSLMYNLNNTSLITIPNSSSLNPSQFSLSYWINVSSINLTSTIMNQNNRMNIELSKNLLMDITNDLVLWLDASQINTSDTSQVYDGKVLKWIDLSGGGNDATQYNIDYSPTYVSSGINNTPTVRFDGIDDYIISNPISSYFRYSHSWFIVFKVNDTSNQRVLIHSGYAYVSDFEYYFISNGSNGHMYIYSGGYGTAETISEDFNNSPSMMYVDRKIYGADGIYSYLNGIYKSKITRSTPSGTFPTWFTIGAQWNGYQTLSGFYSGDISEILFFSRSLSTSEYTLVEDYLMNKYNISSIDPRYYNMNNTLSTTINTYETNSNIQKNDLNHIVLTYDGSYEKLYVNSIQSNNISTSSIINNSSSDFIIKSYNETNYSISNIRYFNYSLSQEEINNLYTEHNIIGFDLNILDSGSLISNVESVDNFGIRSMSEPSLSDMSTLLNYSIKSSLNAVDNLSWIYYNITPYLDLSIYSTLCFDSRFNQTWSSDKVDTDRPQVQLRTGTNNGFRYYTDYSPSTDFKTLCFDIDNYNGTFGTPDITNITSIYFVFYDEDELWDVWLDNIYVIYNQSDILPYTFNISYNNTILTNISVSIPQNYPNYTYMAKLIATNLSEYSSQNVYITSNHTDMYFDILDYTTIALGINGYHYLYFNLSHNKEYNVSGTLSLSDCPSFTSCTLSPTTFNFNNSTHVEGYILLEWDTVIDDKLENEGTYTITLNAVNSLDSINESSSIDVEFTGIIRKAGGGISGFLDGISIPFITFIMLVGICLSIPSIIKSIGDKLENKI